jgi:transcriptional regulator with XRE-family HTH domain
MQYRRFRARLEQELDARRLKNPRYSLRAFAAFLETDHSTLSQILQGRRRVPAVRIRAWARKLGMDRDEAAAYIAAEQLPDASTAQREQQLRHWTAEALSIVADRIHWGIVELSRRPDFRPDCRWIAEQSGVSVDEVNVAFSRLLRLRLMEVTAAGEWRELTHPPVTSEKDFRKLALARIRQEAAGKDSFIWQTQ